MDYIFKLPSVQFPVLSVNLFVSVCLKERERERKKEREREKERERKRER